MQSKKTVTQSALSLIKKEIRVRSYPVHLAREEKRREIIAGASRRPA